MTASRCESCSRIPQKKAEDPRERSSEFSTGLACQPNSSENEKDA